MGCWKSSLTTNAARAKDVCVKGNCAKVALSSHFALDLLAINDVQVASVRTSCEGERHNQKRKLD